MKLVFLGVSGAGKGTQAKKLTKHFNIEHISTGDILREHINDKTEIGKKIHHIMDTGNLVDDDLVIQLVKEKISRPECASGFILDGFPRNLNQAVELSRFQDIDRVIYVMVDDQVVIDRLTGRFICPDCSEMYHVLNVPPKNKGLCDKCGSSLIQREDDKAETVKDRLKIFHELTEPIIKYYEDKGLLFTVSGVGDVDGITQKILADLAKIR